MMTAGDLKLNRDPYELPVTIDTWRRLPDELLSFYVQRSAPTELAARIMLNDSLRRIDPFSHFSCNKARRERRILLAGRELKPAKGGVGRPVSGVPRIPPCRALAVQASAGRLFQNAAG